MKIQFPTEAEIREQFPEAQIKNGFVKKIDLQVIGHFGNLVTLDMPITAGGGISNPLAGYNSTISCGVYIKILFELFGISEEDGIRISAIKDIPCRVVVSQFHMVAVGNFMDDKFIVFKDLPDKYDEFMAELSKNN
jgi:hypothetical protein